MSKLLAFCITLSTGLFFLFGLLISRFAKQRDKIVTFSIGLALSVTLGMVIFDLLPECLEIFKEYSFLEQMLRIGSMVILGIILLKVLDLFVPTHSHHHKENEKNHEEHESHLNHIGIVTSISLFIHNVLEGAAIYTSSLTSVSMGLLMMAGVALHNIPLGIEIATSFAQKQKRLCAFLFTLLVLSPFLGGILISCLPIAISSLLEGYMICLSLGMMLYLVIFELFTEFLAHRNKKESYFGLICGMIIMCIALLL